MDKNEHTLSAFDYKDMWNGFKTKYGSEYMFFEGGNSVEEMMKEYKKEYIEKNKNKSGYLDVEKYYEDKPYNTI